MDHLAFYGFDDNEIGGDGNGQEQEVRQGQRSKAESIGGGPIGEDQSNHNNQQYRDRERQARPVRPLSAYGANDEENQRLRCERFHEPPRHLSIKLCWGDSCCTLESGLEQGIELG